MIRFSILSFFISLLVFISLRFIVFSFEPSNLLAANMLVIILGTAVVSLIFTYQQFRGYGKGKWQNPLFHKTLVRTFLINFVIIMIINFMWQ